MGPSQSDILTHYTGRHRVASGFCVEQVAKKNNKLPNEHNEVLKAYRDLSTALAFVTKGIAFRQRITVVLKSVAIWFISVVRCIYCKTDPKSE